MSVEDAETLIELTETDFSIKNRLFRGMQIIAKYDEDMDIYAEHDQIWCGDFEETVKKMKKSEIEEMAKYGWFPHETSWSHFT